MRSFVEIVTHINSRFDQTENNLPVWLRMILEFVAIGFIFTAFIMLLTVSD